MLHVVTYQLMLIPCFCAAMCWRCCATCAGTWFVRKGQRVDINNVALQRREDQWGGSFGDPNAYNPERFMPGAALVKQDTLSDQLVLFGDRNAVALSASCQVRLTQPCAVLQLSVLSDQLVLFGEPTAVAWSASCHVLEG